MSAPTRRTAVVRLAQLLLLAGWAWLQLRPVANALEMFTMPDGTVQMLVAKQAIGDPLPWAVRPPWGPGGDPVVVGLSWQSWVIRPTPVAVWVFEVIDPFAPLPGLLLALAVPPLLADRLTARRWNRGQLTAVAAAVGGLLLGIGWTVLYGWADHGLIGMLADPLYDSRPANFLRDTLPDLRELRWKLGMIPATLFGLVVGGLTAAGALRPWRRPPAPEGAG